MCYTFPSQESLDLSWLTHLTLNTVNVSRETAEYIFSNCSNIEYVNISRSPSLSGIRVVDTCPKLKHFEISHCQRLEFLEICSAPNLISLSYSGPRETRLCFRDVLNLVDVSLLGKYCTYIIWKFHELPLALAQIQKLKLSPTMENAPCFSKFPKLKSGTELELVFDAVDEHSLFSCTNAIEACPNLCSLSVQFRWMWEPKQRWIREANLAKGKRYKRLKVVEFRGFRGSATDVEIVTYVLSTAAFLEKIIVDTIDSNQTLTSTSTSTKSDDDYLAKLVALQLVAKFSPVAQLVIC